MQTTATEAQCQPIENVELCIANAPHSEYNVSSEVFIMNKTYSMSIRVSEEELNKLKQAARIEAYASYSEFVRRTALIEAGRVIDDNLKKEDDRNAEKNDRAN